MYKLGENMYRSKNRKFNNYRRNNSYGARPRFNSNSRRQIKKLDPSLFINKSLDNQPQIKYVSSIEFSDFLIEEKLKRNIEERGYLSPTEIQEKAMPEILLGRDIIGIANTGTGKTGAFLITLINKAYLDRNQRVLIVVPTRELAVQIEDEFRIFAKGTDLEAVAAIGGADMRRQIYKLRHRPHFVIGTPGRLKDLIDRRDLNLSLFQNIVLDEVDRMLDFGFIHDMKYIISFLPKVRQSLFFSATVDGKTKEILKDFVTNPVTIKVEQENVSKNIHQDIIRVSGGQSKIDALHDLLIQPGFDKVLIFGRTKWGMEKLSKLLIDRGFKTASIHGNKSQNQRQRALDGFRNNGLQILIATDVASRGLDIEDVTHVINYDPPTTHDDYIHRIGRTGRAGKKGIALTFVE